MKHQKAEELIKDLEGGQLLILECKRVTEDQKGKLHIIKHDLSSRFTVQLYKQGERIINMVLDLDELLDNMKYISVIYGAEVR